MSNVEITIRAIDQASKVFKQTGSALENTFKQGEKSSESFSKKLNAGYSSILSAAGGVAAGVYAIKEAFDFAKEGAELDLVASRFENVATAAGYTSDILLGKMKDATNGLVSDADLMKSGLQIIELGLADTEQGVVDLAEVIAVLGLDMQQVIMTFSNNSELRLDALGLSVEKVKDRVAELNEEGFDGDAFDQAVIEGLIDRMNTLGDVAETDAGKIQAMETAFQNLADAAKRRLSPVLAEIAENITTVITFNEKLAEAFGEARARIMDTSMSYDEYVGRMVQVIAMERNLTDEMAEGLRIDLLNRDATMEEMMAYGLLTAEQWSAYRIQRLLNDTTEEGIAPTEELAATAEELAAAEEEVARAAKEAEQNFKDMFSAADQDWDSIWGKFNEGVDYILAGGGAFDDFEKLIEDAGLQWSQLGEDAQNKYGPMMQDGIDKGREAFIKFQQEQGELNFDETVEALIGIGLTADEAYTLASDKSYDWKSAIQDSTGSLDALLTLMESMNGKITDLFVNIYYREHNKPGGAPSAPTTAPGVPLPENPEDAPATIQSVPNNPNNNMPSGGGIDTQLLYSLFSRLGQELMTGIENAIARVA